MDFLILRPLPLKTGYHFFERGGWGWVGWGGGSKVFAQKATSSGEAFRLSNNRRSNGNAANARFAVGGSNRGLLTFRAGGGAEFARLGFETPTQTTPANCITTGPLLALGPWASLLLGAACATDKKPKLCVSV